MKFFADMGALIEQRWRAHNYNEELFPAIAEQALNEMPPHKNVDEWDIVRWLFDATEIPMQQDLPAKFGNPPITLYSGPRFHIDVYYWLDGTTSIHQHAFCGAFHVLAGASIHSLYTFHPRQFINEHFAVGDIKLEQVELLEQGNTKQILPGKAYIHALFHLDRPSATICVRTYHTTSGAPQYNYVKPHFAVDPFFQEQLSTRHIQCAQLLLRMQHPQALEMLDGLLAQADFQTTFGLLDLAWSHLGGKQFETEFGVTTSAERFEQLMETARRRHGNLVDLIPDVFTEVRRQNALIHRRGQITSPEHRFFLALLLNVPDRQRVLEMVKQRFPDQDPADIMTDWLEELSLTKIWGATEPNVLGIADLDDDYLFVFRCLSAGQTLPATIAQYQSEMADDLADDLAEKLTSLYYSIIESDIFHNLFSASAAITRKAGATIS
jgi:hypothetical protein